MTTLNKDTNQVIFDFLSLDDKYVFHKYSEKHDTDNLKYTNKTINIINNMDSKKWAFFTHKNKNINHIFINDYKHKIKWDIIAQLKKLDEKFIEKYIDNFNLKILFSEQKLSEDFIIRHLDRLYDRLWQVISHSQRLSIDFIRTYKDKISFEDLSWNNKSLTNEIIREFQDVLDWNAISEAYSMDSKFITEFNNKINWDLYDMNLHW